MSTLHNHRLRILLLTGLLIAFALRLYRLGAESLWYDETVSVYLASQPVTDLIAHTARDIHPPGYYLLLHFWSLLATPTLAHGLEFLYAWPSLWFGMLTVALVGALAQREGTSLAAGVAISLAAANPFQLMYAQEVRMYAVATACALLTWWSASTYLHTVNRPALSTVRCLGTYAAAAVAGLYTLYYFIFWLAILVPLVAFAVLPRHGRTTSNAPLRHWLIAQAIVIAAWLPWLPIFVRQAIYPPVPPWRTAWASSEEFVKSLLEALAAPLIGQSSPAFGVLPWAILVVAITVVFLIYTKGAHTKLTTASWMLPTLLFGPVALIFAISLMLTPLYHVRYLVTYTGVFPVIAALLVDRLRRSSLMVAALVLLLATTSVASLVNFWRAPQFRADDHRSAVALLAHVWRPGDAILVNAGWVYPALAVYWPSVLDGPLDAIPSAISASPRLTAFLEETAPLPASTSQNGAPVVIRSGSVDGSPTLGWGHPDSDFFAVSTQDTLDALDAVSAPHARLWHYRLYDTVSDPTGVIRTWLDTWGAPFADTVFPGPGYLRLQGYTLAGSVPVEGAPVAQNTTFGPNVHLRQAHVPNTARAGDFLYIVTAWDSIGAAQSDALSTSLRLYAQNGDLVSQADSPLPVGNAPYTTTLALPISAATTPGTYTLDLLVYHQADLSPIPAEPSVYGTPAARLISIQVVPP